MAELGIMQGTMMHWEYIVILAVLAVVVPWRSTARVQTLLRAPELTGNQRIMLYLSTMVFQWGISVVILWRVVARGMTWPELAMVIPGGWQAVVITVALSAILVVNQVLGVKRLASIPREQRGMIARLSERLLPRSWREALFAVGLVATVAVCEEFIYRGFIEAVFARTLASVAAGAVISALFFAVAHLYQGRRGLLITFIVGLIFSGARIWTGSLLPSVIIHFVVDFSAGLAASRVLLIGKTAAPTLEGHS